MADRRAVSLCGVAGSGIQDLRKKWASDGVFEKPSGPGNGSSISFAAIFPSRLVLGDLLERDPTRRPSSASVEDAAATRAKTLLT